jgi:hypothetical protein
VQQGNTFDPKNHPRSPPTTINNQTLVVVVVHPSSTTTTATTVPNGGGDDCPWALHLLETFSRERPLLACVLVALHNRLALATGVEDREAAARALVSKAIDKLSDWGCLIGWLRCNCNGLGCGQSILLV